MALSKRKKKWIFIISIIVILLALIGGNYVKNKYEEHKVVSKAQIAANEYMRDEENMVVVFTDYKFAPMGTLFLYGYEKGNKSRKLSVTVDLMKDGSFRVGGYGERE